MTIKLLTPHGRAPVGALLSLDAATEAAMIAAKVAVNDTSGGALWSDPYAVGRKGLADVQMDRETKQLFSDDSPVGTSIPFRQQPYRIATFGTSRVNAGTSVPAISASGASIRIDRAVAWACALRGDCEIVRNYGLSGGLVRPSGTNGFLLTNRSEGKSLASLLADDVDAVVLDADLINDLTGWDAANPPGGTVQSEGFAILKEVLLRLITAGRRVAVSPGMQSTSAGYGVSPATKRDLFNAVQTALRPFVESLTPYAVWVEEAVATSDANGYFDQANYGVDYGHYHKPGARASAEKVWVAALDKLLPRKTGMMFVNTAINTAQALPNMLSLGAPSTFTGIDTNGTASAVTVTTGVEAGEPYVEFVYTPATLANGECKMRLQINAPVGSYGGATPDYTVAVNDVVQAGARVLLDDGAGGAANVYNFQMRVRNFKQAGGSTQSDWGAFIDPAANPELVGGRLGASALAFRCASARHPLDVASAGIEAPAFGKGLALHVVLQSSVIDGQPIRCRLYSPWLSKVA